MKLTNITAPRYRCTIGACPAVYRSEDGKTLRITGKLYNPEGYCGLPPGFEADVDISADLVLASLGVNDLVKAAEKVARWRNTIKLTTLDNSPLNLTKCLEEFDALRSVLNKIKGGA